MLLNPKTATLPRRTGIGIPGAPFPRHAWFGDVVLPMSALRPELVALIDAGVLARILAGDGTRGASGAFAELALAATRRGDLTAHQARVLAALLGLGLPRPAPDA